MVSVIRWQLLLARGIDSSVTGHLQTRLELVSGR